MRSLRKSFVIVMTILILVSLILSIGIQLFVFTNHYQEVVRNHHMTIGNSIKINVQEFMDKSYSIPVEIANMPSMIDFDPETQNDILMDVNSRYPYFDLICTMDLSGMEIARTTGDLYDFSERWWFIKVMEEKRPFIGKSYYSVIGNQTITSAIIPMFDHDNTMVGILGADIKLVVLQELVEKFSDEHTYAYIIDGEGVVVAHPDEERLAELYNYKTLERSVLLRDENGQIVYNDNGYPMSEIQSFEESESLRRIVVESLEGHTDYIRYKNADGEVVYSYYTPIELPGTSDNWAVITVEKEEHAFSFIREIITFSVFLMVGIILLITVASNYLSKKIVRPIEDLTAVTNQIIDGDYVTFDKDINQKETKVLTDAFNSMVTTIRDKEKYILDLALIDPLTEIPNRRSFMEEFEKKLSDGFRCAICLVDIDNFKDINDTMGHLQGDKLLKDISQFLKEFRDEKVFVSRFGGDEFLILYENFESIKEIHTFSEEMSHSFNERFNTGNYGFITFSMGIALYPEHHTDVYKLLAYADTAMYSVKASGKNNYDLFDKDMLSKIEEKVIIEKALREAIDSDGFKLLYQPLLDVKSEMIVSAEALIRLCEHEISPAKFIPVAEESGMIIPIGRWTIEETFRFISKLKKEGYPTVPISINFSPIQINDLEFIEFLEEKMSLYDIQPQDYYLEITEGVYLADEEKAIQLLHELRQIGVKTALDDFGTGYSSINYLSFLDVDYLKIDKVISDKFLHTGDMRIIKGIVNFGHSLNLEVVAEGIEAQEQVSFLKEIECDIVQGYYYSRPLEEKAFVDYMMDLKI